MDRRNRLLVSFVTTAMLAACSSELVPSTESADSSGPEPETTSETSTTTTTDGSSTTDELPEDSSSSGAPPDLGVDMPEPPGPSRLLVDVDGDNGHTLELHEIIDGEPQPPIRLLPDSPTGATFEVTPVGPADRVVLDVEYSNGSHEIFVVDWSAGLPAAVTSIGTASYTAAVTWVESIDAVVVRTGSKFERVDLGGSLEPVELLGDLPFGLVFDQSPLVVMPVGPFLAVSGSTFGADIYIGDIVDPSAATLQVTDFGGTEYFPQDPKQSPSGHVAFQVASYDELPHEIYVLPRTGDGWGELLKVASPADPPEDRYMIGLQPQHDAFVYAVELPGDPDLGALMLGGIEGGQLGAPIVLAPGYGSQHELSADGRRLLYSTGAPDTLRVIDLDDEGASAPRHVYGVHGEPVANVRILGLSPDGEYAFAALYDLFESFYDTRALIRVGLSPGSTVETIAGHIGNEERISDRVVFPDGLAVAFTSTSSAGYITHIVDCSGPIAGPPVLAEQGDAPIISALVPSPDSEWLAIEGGSGGQTPGTIRVVGRSDPAVAILAIDGVRGPTVWLPPNE